MIGEAKGGATVLHTLSLRFSYQYLCFGIELLGPTSSGNTHCACSDSRILSRVIPDILIVTCRHW